MLLQHSFVVCLMLLALIVVSESTHRKQRVDAKCGQGWRAFGKVKCFKLIEGKLSQEEGAKKCKKEEPGSSLAKIANKVEQRFITRQYLAEISSTNPKEEVSVWTDGKRDKASECEDGFKWEDGIEVDASMVPLGRSMGKDCLTLAMRASGNESNASQWLAHRCEDKADYVLCEKDCPKEQIATTLKPTTTPRPTPRPTPVPMPNAPLVCKGDGWFAGTDSCFKRYRMIYGESAIKYCNEAATGEDAHLGVRARLAIIKTPEEQAIVTAEMHKSVAETMREFEKEYKSKWSGGNGWNVWLGARRVPGTNTFKWDDGSEMQWTNWAPNQPKGRETGADCVVLSTMARTVPLGFQNTRWASVHCDEVEMTLCQKIPK